MLAALVLVPLVLAQAPVRPTTAVTGTLAFDARATVGDFTGQTSAIRGELTGGPGPESVRGWVEALVDSLRTGNGRRDRDMRKSLEADRFPAIRFELDELRPSPLQGTTMVATLAGRFTIHGVTRQVAVPATLTWDSQGIHVEAAIPMDVRDYRVGGLSKLLGVLRMEPEIIVRVDLVFALPPG